MGRLIIHFLGIFLCLPFAKAATDTTLHLQLQKIIPGNYKNFTTDNLGNIFLVTTANRIKKLNQNFDSVSVFNDVRQYGDIFSLDVNNPLKIAIYYSDFSTILSLDRFLNIRNTIDLRKSDILQAKAIAQSYDNNYWVFDELDNAIKKIDDNGNILLRSPDFRTFLNEPFNPARIIDRDGLLYLYDNKKGWLIFDYYGAYKQQIPWPQKQDVQVTGDQFYGHDSLYFVLYNSRLFTEQKMLSSADLSHAIKAERMLNKAYILLKDGLYIYSITD